MHWCELNKSPHVIFSSEGSRVGASLEMRKSTDSHLHPAVNYPALTSSALMILSGTKKRTRRVGNRLQP
ncbi:uncharacterized [Tachysurus ichikawai]